MAALEMHKSPRCQHVHYSGKPCKAPARRGRNYCVFHQAAHFDAGGCVLPIVEDLHSYQLAIIRIARALADDIIDPRKATALLYAMQLVGAKIEAFAQQRAEVEDPARALYNEVSQRYQARKFPVPAIPEKDLLAILKEMSAERFEPNEHPEIIPDPTDQKSEIENQRSPAPDSSAPAEHPPQPGNGYGNLDQPGAA